MYMFGATTKFVIHEHHAKRAGLHYDLRIQIGDVLKSWVIPKRFDPEFPGVRLAIPVVDHEIDCMTFEGEIPAGQYGHGTMKIWDSGEVFIKKITRGYHLEFYGAKISGHYYLIHGSTKFKGFMFYRKSILVADPNPE